jgi:hypothetical protein
LIAPLFILDIPIVGERRLFGEVGRAAQLLEIGAAFVALIVIHDGKRQIVDVGRDSEAEHHHQKHRTKQGEGQPDGIAQKLDRLADRIGTKPLPAEGAPPWRRRLLHRPSPFTGRNWLRLDFGH